MNTLPVFEVHDWDLAVGRADNRLVLRPLSDDTGFPNYKLAISPGHAQLLIRDLSSALKDVSW